MLEPGDRPRYFVFPTGLGKPRWKKASQKRVFIIIVHVRTNTSPDHTNRPCTDYNKKKSNIFHRSFVGSLLIFIFVLVLVIVVVGIVCFFVGLVVVVSLLTGRDLKLSHPSSAGLSTRGSCRL